MWPCRGRAAQSSRGGHMLSESPQVCGREAPETHTAGPATRAKRREELLASLFILLTVTHFSSFVFQNVSMMCSFVTHSGPSSVFVHSVPNRRPVPWCQETSRPQVRFWLRARLTCPPASQLEPQWCPGRTSRPCSARSALPRPHPDRSCTCACAWRRHR